jgi:hypothetical protein
MRIAYWSAEVARRRSRFVRKWLRGWRANGNCLRLAFSCGAEGGAGVREELRGNPRYICCETTEKGESGRGS